MGRWVKLDREGSGFDRKRIFLFVLEVVRRGGVVAL